MLNTRAEAYKLLDDLDAPAHLKEHVRLVGEAAGGYERLQRSVIS